MITNLSLDPTYFCNENCVSCRCSSVAAEFNNEMKLTKDNYFSIIRQFADAGGKSISIYGGEPLLFTSVFEVLIYAKNNNLKTSITTNGILLQNGMLCKKLIETDVNQIIISIMGVKNVYDMMHGGIYYYTFLSAMKQLIQSDISIVNKLSFHVTIQRGNYNQLPEIVKLAAELGIMNISCQYVSLVDTEDNHKSEVILNTKFDNKISHWELTKDLLVTKEHIKDLINSIEIATELAVQNGIKLSIDPVFYSKDLITYLTTGKYNPKGKCDLCDLIVLPDGRVGACAMLQHYIVGNVKEQSVLEIINSKKYNELRKRVEKGLFLPICSGCCRHTMFFDTEQ